MKAIIFDLDNTLIDWKKEYIRALKKVAKETNLDLKEEVVSLIDKSIDEYERQAEVLTKEGLLRFINKRCHTNLKLDFINNLIEEQKTLFEIDTELINTLKYLSNKYDLYVITNWFTETQIGRMKGMKIDKYFKGIIGADENYYKPNKKAYNCILNKYKKEDCLSVGDSLENDILIPLELGMKAIWKTNKKSKLYKTIKSIKELEEIL